VKIDEGQQKIKIFCTKSSTPTDNQIYAVPANQFSPSAGTTLLHQPTDNQIYAVLANQFSPSVGTTLIKCSRKHCIYFSVQVHRVAPGQWK